MVTADANPAVEFPRLVAGRYVLEQWLGSGEQKNVYLGRDPAFDRPVAVALSLVPSADGRRDAFIESEAKVLAQLGHLPHVVNVFDTGIERDTSFIVSEYMAGGTAGDLCKYAKETGEPIALERVLTLGCDIAAGLAEIHGSGIIHRDVQPQNVWLEAPEGSARLGDFDLAIKKGDPGSALSNSLTTCAYMAPELCSGATADERSDLYSFGASLYEIATGGPPFTGSDEELIQQHQHAEPMLPSSRRADIPHGLDDLIVRLLAKDPADRPASALETIDTLQTIAHPRQPPIDLQALIALGEGPSVEFKRSFREPDNIPPGVGPDQRDRALNELRTTLGEECVITVAGFLNAQGGTLLVGVRDDGTIAGIETDLESMNPKRPDQLPLDMWEMYLRNALKQQLGSTASARVSVSFRAEPQGTVAIIQCDRGSTGTWIRDSDFYVRAGNSTPKLTPREAAAYQARHWAR
jgi:serine/threonine protein kinase